MIRFLANALFVLAAFVGLALISISFERMMQPRHGGQCGVSGSVTMPNPEAKKKRPRSIHEVTILSRAEFREWLRERLAWQYWFRENFGKGVWGAVVSEEEIRAIATAHHDEIEEYIAQNFEEDFAEYERFFKRRAQREAFPPDRVVGPDGPLDLEI